MKFIIFHGAFSNPESNWFPELKEKLEALGQQVLVPTFPVDSWGNVTKQGKNYKSKIQTLDNWLKVFDQFFKTFKKGEKICFIGHSLGPLFILHIVEKYKIKLDSAIFVSPFTKRLDMWQFNAVNNTFYKTDFNFKKLKKLIPISYVLFSENDPYVKTKQPQDFAQKMGSSAIQIRRAGHLNSEVNLNEFPLILEICKTRLDLSLYQKYLAHRKELYAIDYIKDKSEEVIYLPPEEIFNEGVFKFRNLRSRGFCTLYTALDFWDVRSKYFEEARKAANRIKNFTRVFLIEKLEDLKKPSLVEQIKLDLEAGIKVYICKIEDIKNVLSSQPDFGIWDDEYLCVVESDEKNKVSRIRMSSVKEDIKQAKIREEEILKKATRLYSTEDFRIVQNG